MSCYWVFLLLAIACCIPMPPLIGGLKGFVPVCCCCCLFLLREANKARISCDYCVKLVLDIRLVFSEKGKSAISTQQQQR